MKYDGVTGVTGVSTTWDYAQPYTSQSLVSDMMILYEIHKFRLEQIRAVRLLPWRLRELGHNPQVFSLPKSNSRYVEYTDDDIEWMQPLGIGMHTPFKIYAIEPSYIFPSTLDGFSFVKATFD